MNLKCGPDEVWIDELSPDRSKHLVLTILHHCQLTSIVDDTHLRQTTAYGSLKHFTGAKYMKLQHKYFHHFTYF